MKNLKTIFFLLILAFSLNAQDSKGNEFWIMFNQNQSNSITLKLYISSDIDANGTVEIPGAAFIQPFSTTAGVITEIILPFSAYVNTNGISDKGVHVTADEDITVYGFNLENFTSDAFLCLPVDAIGSEYIALAYNGLSGLSSEIGIVASELGTTSVTITPTANANGNLAGIPFNVNLTQGQTYLLKGDNATHDLTGTSVSSDKNVGVFSGSRCSNVPVGTTFCDHLVEQMTPLSAWGKDFVTVPLATRLNGDTYRFLAQIDNTNVLLNGLIIATLNEGEFHEQIISGFNSISASEAILVGQYSNGSSYDGVISDPFLLLVPPTEQFITDYVFNSGETNIPFNYVNIVAETDHLALVELDNVTVPAVSWTLIPGTDFSAAQMEISSGQHSINSDFPVGVFVYGFGNFDSYGYLGGQSFSPVATVTSIDATPETQTIFLGDEVCIDALVLDQFDEPVEDVIVDFTVTGDIMTSGFDNTNADGIATFCFTPGNGGTAMVNASIFGLEDDVEVIIEECNIEISANVSDESCYYANDGSIDLTLSNFNDINSISWSNGETTEDIDELDNGDYTVTINYDADCEAEMTYSVGTFLENDDDCDGVDNICDECPGGDDTVDNNNDGMPDCKYPPAKSEIIAEWKCGKNLKKIFVCHIPPGNPENSHTICVSYNSIQSHINHGDYIGPCGNASCDEGLSRSSRVVNSDNIQVYPNPVSDILHIDLTGSSIGDQVNLIDQFGHTVYVIQTEGNLFSFDIDMSQVNISSGLYYISTQIDGKPQMKKVIVQK